MRGSNTYLGCSAFYYHLKFRAREDHDSAGRFRTLMRRDEGVEAPTSDVVPAAISLHPSSLHHSGFESWTYADLSTCKDLLIVSLHCSFLIITGYERIHKWKRPIETLVENAGNIRYQVTGRFEVNAPPPQQ